MKKFEIFHHIDKSTIDRFFADYSPVFVLSTGRCGTKFLHSLLSQNEQIQSYHEAFPNLQYFPNYAFHHQTQKELLVKMIAAARMELILDAFNNNKIFFESNHCLTFFSPALAELFKRSKFIHLIRHPGDFVVSAIKKGWHKNDSIWEEGRIKAADRKDWEDRSQIEKLAWTWFATNHYIQEFGRSLASDRFTVFRIEDIYSDQNAIDRLQQFIGVTAGLANAVVKGFQGQKINAIEIHPNEPANMKKVLVYPEYADWDDDDKNQLGKYANPLAEKFNYRL